MMDLLRAQSLKTKSGPRKHATPADSGGSYMCPDHPYLSSVILSVEFMGWDSEVRYGVFPLAWMGFGSGPGCLLQIPTERKKPTINH